jgi:hypothetical protein
VSRTNWKQRERDVAARVGGKRFPANMGGKVDVEAPGLVIQVKERKAIRLAELEVWAVEMAELARAKGALGLVYVKRSAGSGVKTPWLVVALADHLEPALPGTLRP